MITGKIRKDSSFPFHVSEFIGCSWAVLFTLLFNHHFNTIMYGRHSSSGPWQLPICLLLFREGPRGLVFYFGRCGMLYLGVILITNSQRVGSRKHCSCFYSSGFLLGINAMGVYIIDVQIGSNPFVIVKRAPGHGSTCHLSESWYFDFVEGGLALNPLLPKLLDDHPPFLFYFRVCVNAYYHSLLRLQV